jgi:hypothetical protein
MAADPTPAATPTTSSPRRTMPHLRGLLVSWPAPDLGSTRSRDVGQNQITLSRPVSDCLVLAKGGPTVGQRRLGARRAVPAPRRASTSLIARTAQRSSPALARDLPETGPRVASRHPTTPPLTPPRTCGAVGRSGAPQGLSKGPSVNGKDGVAGSIPAGGSTPNPQARPGPAPRPVAY